MRAGHRVNVLAARQLSVRPQRLVPAAAHEPLAGSGSLGAGRDVLLHPLKRPGAAQIDAEQFQPRMFQMNVGIVEARHHKVAAEINNVRAGALQPADLVVRANGKNAAVAYRHRLRARRCRLRVNVSIEEDGVGWLGAGIASGRVGVSESICIQSEYRQRH
jgi:hypothetical protein